MTMIIFIVSLGAIMAMGVPIAFALLLSAVFMMLYLDNFSAQIIAQNVISGADNYTMMAVPFFILAGDLMGSGGLSKRIVNMSLALMGHVRGGLGYVTILVMVLFAGLAGSAVASAAALGAILIPMMADAGYSRERATALIASGSLIDPIIPPSIPMIVFGVIGGVSISKLFVSGIFPGLMMAVALAVTWGIVSRKDNVAPLPRRSFKEMVKAILEAVWALLLPTIIVVGMRTGIFTATEASVVAVAYAIFVGSVVYKELTLKIFFRSVVSAAKMTSVVMFLLAAAMVSAWLIAIANIPQTVTEILQPFMGNRLILMLIINVVIIVIGTAMDATPTILILTPVLMPIVKQAGIDPVYFGLIFVLNNMIGLLTPPVGTVLNVACSAGKVSFERLVVAVTPFFLVETALLFLFIVFPGLVTVPLGWFF